MTWEELEKVPFHFVSSFSMADKHTLTYSSKDGRLGFCDITKMKYDFEIGRTYRHFRIGDKWYKSRKKFEEALKDFEL